MNIPECPICMEQLSVPVYQCVRSHSICNGCSFQINECPICRVPFERQLRNLGLEDLISSIQETCPHSGCGVTLNKIEIIEHKEDCQFMKTSCPFGTCTWSGPANEISPHFQACHINNFMKSHGTFVNIENVTLNRDNTTVYLIMEKSLPFIMTFKIDVQQSQCYWILQKIGSMKSALEYFYTINLISLVEKMRRASLSDNCFNDSKEIDEIVESGKCAIIPLESLPHFMKDDKVHFQLFINKVNTQKKQYE